MMDLSSTRRSNNSFPFKLYAMLEYVANSPYSSAVSWNQDGRSFIILNVSVFTKEIAPKFFKLTKYRSFTRQLNIWGFNNEECGWTHKHFVRGNVDELQLICRKAKGTTTAMMQSKKSNGPKQQPRQQGEMQQPKQPQQQQLRRVQSWNGTNIEESFLIGSEVSYHPLQQYQPFSTRIGSSNAAGSDTIQQQQQQQTLQQQTQENINEISLISSGVQQSIPSWNESNDEESLLIGTDVHYHPVQPSLPHSSVVSNNAIGSNTPVKQWQPQRQSWNGSNYSETSSDCSDEHLPPPRRQTWTPSSTIIESSTETGVSNLIQPLNAWSSSVPIIDHHTIQEDDDQLLLLTKILQLE